LFLTSTLAIPPKFNPEKARLLGVPKGPLFGEYRRRKREREEKKGKGKKSEYCNH
jgi:hypothetical protein